MRILIIGCGYAGLTLGERLVRAGHEVHGLRRTGAAEMRNRGIQPVLADITATESLASLKPDYDVVVNLASSSRGGVDEYRAVYFEGTRNILAWLRRHPPLRYIYTSSTSVYAQKDGSIVTEESPAMPSSETSQILRQTEELLLAQHDVPAIILRTSGIYGPGRGHLFKQFVRGEAVLRDDGQAYLNMVHVEDVAGAIEVCLGQAVSPGIYNLNDDEPVTQRAFFTWLAEQLNRPLPAAAPSDPGRKRGVTNKRVSNQKLKLVTGYRFFYPTFREGYAAEVAQLR